MPALAAIVAAAITFLGSLSPAASAFSPTPLDLDILVTSDEFERPFPGTNWTVADSDPTNGTDYWASSSYRSFAGNGSVWASGVGTQERPVTVFTEGFENGSTGWTLKDDDASYGSDTWGVDSYRPYSGSNSLWAGRTGTQSNNGTSNLVCRCYDDYMDAYAIYPIDLSAYTSVTMDFEYTYETESGWDYFYAGYDDGGYTFPLADLDGGTIGNWLHESFSVPSTATALVFFFDTDTSVHDGYEGVYIDDIVVSGLIVETNTALRTYDGAMNATMSRPIDVDSYASARVEYRYWLETGAGNDSLQAGYNTDGNWTFLNVHTNTTSGWVLASFSMPVNTTRIAFRFVTDLLGDAEGAYLDGVKVWGTVRTLTCTASVDVLGGMEAISVFSYNGSAAEGMRPYVWTWSFSDGPSSLLQNPQRYYSGAGSYDATLSVRDAVGQVCTAVAPTVSVDHDTTAASVIPLLSNVVEGGTIQLSGADGQGHPYSMDWLLDPPSCGALSAGSGVSTTFTASPEAGGSVCRVQGSIGAVSANATLNILHDTSAISISPPGATAVEGKSLVLSSADRYGHGLDFSWSTTCGRLSIDLGPSSTFTAVTTGGTVCTVTAAIGADSTTASVSVVHDTSDIVLTPPSASIKEGTEQAFSAVDVYTHPFDATWAVTPVACGGFTSTTGTSTRFQSSSDAGGLACIVSAAFGADRKNITVTVTHDTSLPSLSPTSVNAVEGSTHTFSVSDTFGHPLSVSWNLGPASCGVLSAATGALTTVSVSVEAGGTSCTLTATGLGVNLGASISVLHLSAASVRVTVSATEVDEGTSVTATAAVVDGANHTLAGLSIDWSTTCGVLSTATGASKTLQLPDDANASASCTVTAGHATYSGSATVAMRHAGPYTVAIDPPAPTVGGGGAQAMSALVTDGHGHSIPGASVKWTSTCGVLSAAEGASVTYTAPGDLGGTNCKVSAEYTDPITEASAASAPASVTVPMSALVPVGILVPLAAVGAAVFLMMKRRRGAKDIAAAEDLGTPPAEGASALGGAPASVPAAIAGGAGAAVTASIPAAPAEAKALTPPPVSTAAPSKPASTTAPAKAPAKPAATAPAKPGTTASPKTSAPAKPPATPAKTTVPAKPPTAPSKPAAPEATAPPATKPAAPAGTQPAGTPVEAPCPKCGKPVEVGWAACPECGLDLVWK